MSSAWICSRVNSSLEQFEFSNSLYFEEAQAYHCNILQVSHYAFILRGYREGSTEVHFFIADSVGGDFFVTMPQVLQLLVFGKLEM